MTARDIYIFINYETQNIQQLSLIGFTFSDYTQILNKIVAMTLITS